MLSENNLTLNGVDTHLIRPQILCIGNKLQSQLKARLFGLGPVQRQLRIGCCRVPKCSGYIWLSFCINLERRKIPVDFVFLLEFARMKFLGEGVQCCPFLGR